MNVPVELGTVVVAAVAVAVVVVAPVSAIDSAIR